MNTRTGQITAIQPGETLAEMAQRTGQDERDLIALDQWPAPACPKCKGKGVVKRGLFSRRFKPCDCTSKPQVPNPVFK